MGVSSTQVISRDDLDWNSHTLSQSQTLDIPRPSQAIRRQQNQGQVKPLKCPRCDSTNTKFCYYNNYNKSQPRHFCKTCKRHWTEGGTLRNVPFGGGGSKNKRLKSAINTTTSATTTTSSNSTEEFLKRVRPSLEIGAQEVGDQKSMSNMLHQASLDNSNNLNGVFMSSALFPPQNQSLSFPHPISSCFDTRPGDATPTSFVSSSFYDYNSQEVLEDSTITTTVPPLSSSIMWQVANASNGLEYWNLDDIDDLVSTDLNVTWDDPEVKP